ncbi:hypothetical protein F7725_021620 [Dissostichus mawsoni]|uniref:Uncharacterized protein n=1 Tax=Dissostichus mawsoni TaxID=36200 RepID=A0A7J5ZDN1_DISMA|nr:hypothetical protein F7725_021620 [Dissostichus mawsoni]
MRAQWALRHVARKSASAECCPNPQFIQSTTGLRRTVCRHLENAIGPKQTINSITRKTSKQTRCDDGEHVPPEISSALMGLRHSSRCLLLRRKMAEADSSERQQPVASPHSQSAQPSPLPKPVPTAHHVPCGPPAPQVAALATCPGRGKIAKFLSPEEMTSRDYYFDSYAHFGIHEVG